MSGSSDFQTAPHAWDASGTLWNPITMSSHAAGPAGTSSKPQRTRGRSGGRTTCQVPGCTESLVDCKPYFKRHLVCQTHAVSPVVTLDGTEMRFCQQCAKFERLAAFDGGNRSCRLRLFRRNVAKHRTQLAKRVAQSSDEPEARPSQDPKHGRVPSPTDLAADTRTGVGTASEGAGQPRTPSSQPQDRSGGSSGEPDTRCWDAEPFPSHFWGLMGGKDWRNQATSGPTKRTKLTLSGAAVTAAVPSDGGAADENDAARVTAVGAARQPHSKQQKRRQRTALLRPKEDSKSESGTIPSQGNSKDVHDDVDATLAPFTLGLRLDRRSEDTEPSAHRVGAMGVTTPEIPACTSAAQSASPSTHHRKQLQSMAHPTEQPVQQSPSSRCEESKDRAPARPGRVLQSIGGASSAALYDAITRIVSEPVQRTQVLGATESISNLKEATAQRLRELAVGVPNLSVRTEMFAESGAAAGTEAVGVPLAMQVLSNRPDINQSDRQALESLLGLTSGPVAALRPMSASTSASLDEQLYDIMHDMMREGCSDSYWFRGSPAAAAEPAPASVAPLSARSKQAGGSSSVVGSVAAACSYLGMPVMAPERHGMPAGLEGSGSRSEPYSRHHLPGGYDSIDIRYRDVHFVPGCGQPSSGPSVALADDRCGGKLKPQGVASMPGGPGRTLAGAIAAEMSSPDSRAMTPWALSCQQQEEQQHAQRQVPLPPHRQMHFQQQQQPQVPHAAAQQHPTQQHYQQQHAHPGMPLQLQQPQQQLKPHPQQPVQLPQQQQISTELQLQELQHQQRTLEQKLHELQQRKLQIQLQHQQEHQKQFRTMGPTVFTTTTTSVPAASSFTSCDTSMWVGARGGGPAAASSGAYPDQQTVEHSHLHAHDQHMQMQQQQHRQQQQQYPPQHMGVTGFGSSALVGQLGAQHMHAACHVHPHTRIHTRAHPQPHAGTSAPGFADSPSVLQGSGLSPQQSQHHLLPPQPPPPPPAPVSAAMSSHSGSRSWAVSAWGDVPPLVRGNRGGSGDVPYPGHSGRNGDSDGRLAGVTSGTFAGAWGVHEATESAGDDYYHSPLDTVRLSFKMMDCNPYDMDPMSTQELLHHIASEGGRCSVPHLASMRPGCVRIVINAAVRAADAQRDGDHCRAPRRHLDQEVFSARSGEVVSAVRQLAVLNETSVMLQAGNTQLLSVDKTGREVAPERCVASATATAGMQLPPPVLTRASMAAAAFGARGSFQVYGSGLSGPNVEFWGRFQGVHYQLQVHHTCGDCYALVQLPALANCGLLMVEAATAADAVLLSDWLALLIVPTERVATEINGLQSRLPPASLRRLLVDFGSLLDVLPLLSQPVNGVCPVMGQLGGPGSGCSKNTWRSSSAEHEAGCSPSDGCGTGVDEMADGPGSSDAPATVAGVLSLNMSYADTLSTLASSHGGPQSKSSTQATSLGDATCGGLSTTSSGAGFNGAAVNSLSGRAAVAAALTSVADDGGSNSQSAAPVVDGANRGAPLKLSAHLLASIAERAAASEALSCVGGCHAAVVQGDDNVRRLLRCFDPSELLTNGDDETVLQQVLGPESVRLLLMRTVSVTLFFAQRLLVDSALCAVSALSELYFAFPDLLRADLAPTPQRGAPNLMHAAVRSRSLALLLALARCSPVLGDNASLAWPGPGGMTPLHLVALLGQPHVITGLQLAVPEVQEMWNGLRDDNGVTPAEMLMQALQILPSGVRAAGASASSLVVHAPSNGGNDEGLPPPCAAVLQAAASASRALTSLAERPGTAVRVPMAAAAGSCPADTASEQGSDFFCTPLPSPLPSSPLSMVADRISWLDAEAAATAAMGTAGTVAASPKSSWPDWGQLAAVINDNELQLAADAMGRNGLANDNDGALLSAMVGGFESFTVTGATCSDNAHDGPSPEITANDAPAEAGPEMAGPEPSHQPQGLEPQGALHREPSKGMSLSSLPGLALNVARRLMPW